MFMCIRAGENKMRLWLRKEMNSTIREAHRLGIDLARTPSKDSTLFESLVFGGLIIKWIKLGYRPTSRTLDMSITNTIPYRRITQASHIGERVSRADLVKWATPIMGLERQHEYLSVFRQGSPLLMGRERPDILVYNVRFEVEASEDLLMGQLVTVKWNGDREEGYRLYSVICNSEGPICRRSNGERPSPVLGIEISLDKKCDRLLEQVQVLKAAGSKAIHVFLAHQNPCPAGTMPKQVRVHNVSTSDSFRRAIAIAAGGV